MCEALEKWKENAVKEAVKEVASAKDKEIVQKLTSHGLSVGKIAEMLDFSEKYVLSFQME